VIQIDDDVLLSVADDYEKASFLLLRDVSLLLVLGARRVRTWAPFRINAGIRESLWQY
jgi:hypothetical protein